jgi:Tfp pilus assembly protein PilX
MKQPPHQSSSHRQRGFVLVVCLIILLVLTVLGVNSMGTINLEQRMASNSQNKYETFQITESAIYDTFATGTDIDTVITTGVAVTTPNNTYGSDYTTSTTTSPKPADLRYLTGYNVKMFRGDTVEIIGTTTSAGTGARSQLAQGATKISPQY